jgi:aminoglycoside phosphotransferase (APT) family kinase protein
MINQGDVDVDDRAPGARRIDTRLVRELVRSQFEQWAELPVRPVPVDGWDNRTFRLGRTLTVRLPSAAGYVEQVAKEQRWLPVLAPRLPLPIPEPVAVGRPTADYPWPWSIYRWIDGTPAESAHITDPMAFATTLAGFLRALAAVETEDAPAPGTHNFFRGAPLAVYDDETRPALDVLADRVPVRHARQVWQRALNSRWDAAPVWFHGDVSAGNLLTRQGELRAVIDFGSCGVGDPACDLVIAWTLLTGAGAKAFQAALPWDARTWERARGWALWKSVITIAGDEHGPQAAAAARTLERVLADDALPDG